MKVPSLIINNAVSSRGRAGGTSSGSLPVVRMGGFVAPGSGRRGACASRRFLRESYIPALLTLAENPHPLNKLAREGETRFTSLAATTGYRDASSSLGCCS